MTFFYGLDYDGWLQISSSTLGLGMGLGFKKKRKEKYSIKIGIFGARKIGKVGKYGKNCLLIMILLREIIEYMGWMFLI